MTDAFIFVTGAVLALAGVRCSPFFMRVQSEAHMAFTIFLTGFGVWLMIWPFLP